MLIYNTLGRKKEEFVPVHAGKANMAYSALYSNNKKQAERYFNQAKSLAGRSADQRPFQRLEAAYKERKEIWEKN